MRQIVRKAPKSAKIYDRVNTETLGNNLDFSALFFLGGAGIAGGCLFVFFFF